MEGLRTVGSCTESQLMASQPRYHFSQSVLGTASLADCCYLRQCLASLGLDRGRNSWVPGCFFPRAGCGFLSTEDGAVGGSTMFSAQVEGGAAGVGSRADLRWRHCAPQETSDKSVIELQQYAKKNKPNLHILSKLQEEMKRLAEERVSTGHGSSIPLPPRQGRVPRCVTLWLLRGGGEVEAVP